MRRLSLIVALALLVPLPAAAHGGDHAHHWLTLDPWVWMPMAAALLLYLRGIRNLRARRSMLSAAHPAAIACFLAGMAALALALIWPLDALSSISFAAHMGQHMVLIAAAAPLLVLASPAAPLRLGLGTSVRRLNRHLGFFHRTLHVLLRPGIAFVVHGILVWAWHAPLLFEWALRLPWVHTLEHLCFLGSALLFWAAMQELARKPGGHGACALWTLGTLMHTGLLGALLTFAPRPLYALGTQTALLTPLEDQQLAGLIMWIPGGFLYLFAGLAHAGMWLREAAQPQAREAEPR